jgi:CheY-like chemotaxis protein
LLTVRDTGTGMPEAVRARVFEPFFTTKERGKGTGLGLATVHGIVKQSQGHISVESEAGLGTTFKVFFPSASEPVASEPGPAAVSSAPRGSETLLLVEDEEPVRKLAGHILRDCGYRVLEAGDGSEAIRVCLEEAGPIQLVISDAVLPFLSGSALAERIKELRPDCRVLFMSGYTDDAVLRHGVLESGYAFLQKPFRPADLALTVRQILDGADQSG